MKAILLLLIIIAVLLVVMDIAVIYAAREVEKKERELFENRRSRSNERGYLKNRWRNKVIWMFTV